MVFSEKGPAHTALWCACDASWCPTSFANDHRVIIESSSVMVFDGMSSGSELTRIEQFTCNRSFITQETGMAVCINSALSHS